MLQLSSTNDSHPAYVQEHSTKKLHVSSRPFLPKQKMQLQHVCKGVFRSQEHRLSYDSISFYQKIACVISTIFAQAKDAAPACVQGCVWMARGHGLSARRQGGSSPAVHTPQHPQRPGAGTTTSTRGHRHHSHSQARQWYQPLPSQHFKYIQAPSMPQDTPVYPSIPTQ